MSPTARSCYYWRVVTVAVVEVKVAQVAAEAHQVDEPSTSEPDADESAHQLRQADHGVTGDEAQCLEDFRRLHQAQATTEAQACKKQQC